MVIGIKNKKKARKTIYWLMGWAILMLTVAIALIVLAETGVLGDGSDKDVLAGYLSAVVILTVFLIPLIRAIISLRIMRNERIIFDKNERKIVLVTHNLFLREKKIEISVDDIIDVKSGDVSGDGSGSETLLGTLISDILGGI